jgi:nucleotide-binding universal stress UspA family protein
MEDTTGTTVRDQVLVGVDGSENCARAFDIALAVAKRRGWSMRLVGGYLIPSLGYESGPVVAQNYEKVLEEHARVPLDALAESAEADGVDVSTAAVAEHAADALVRESADAGLVVVGKRGRNRFAGRFLGSVSAALAAHSHCPTLVIPEKWETPDPTKLLAPRQEQPGGEDAEVEPTQLLTESTPPKPRGPGFHNVDEEMNFRQEVVVGVDLSDDAQRVALVAAQIAELFGRPLTLVAQPGGVQRAAPHGAEAVHGSSGACGPAGARRASGAQRALAVLRRVTCGSAVGGQPDRVRCRSGNAGPRGLRRTAPGIGQSGGAESQRVAGARRPHSQECGVTVSGSLGPASEAGRFALSGD